MVKLGAHPSFLGVILDAPEFFMREHANFSLIESKAHPSWWYVLSGPYFNKESPFSILAKHGYGPFSSPEDANAWLTWALLQLS